MIWHFCAHGQWSPRSPRSSFPRLDRFGNCQRAERGAGHSFGDTGPPEVTDGPVEATERARRGVASMTLRKMLGDDERLVHQQVDDL